MKIQRTGIIMIMAIGILSAAAIGTAGESSKKAGITWVNLDEGLKLASKTDKMVFIDFYTNWCKFCHKMDNETFSDKQIIDYFNDHFIAVKVNAESNTKLNLPDGELSGREVSRQYGVRGYPTYWFLKSNGEKINYTSGYAPPTRFLPMLQFIGDKHYENMTFREFIESNSKKD